MSLEGGFPFVSFGNVDQMVCMSEVNLGVNMSLVGRIQEVGDEGKQISIFFRDFVESAEIYTEPEGAIFLFYKQDWRSVRRRHRADESISKVFINEFLQYFLFEFGQGIDGSYWRMGIFFQINPEVLRMVGSKCFCFGLAKNIGILMVFLQDGRAVDFFGDSGGFGLHCGIELERICC